MGFRVGDSSEFDKDAWYYWSVNEMKRQSAEVHNDMLGLVWGYAIVGRPDETGVPIITREDPRQCITEHDPLRPSRVTAALKMYRDEIAEKDYAYLYLPGECYIASRAYTEAQQDYDISTYDWDLDAWENDGKLDVPGVVPVVCFQNVGPVAGKPMAEFEPYIQTLMRINETVLHRAVITKLQAFKQRAILGELPLTQPGLDEDGNQVEVPIDYAELFVAAPGAFWMTQAPPEEVKIWESQQSTIQDILNAVKDDVKYLAAETSTPLSMLLPEGENQSAEGAASAKEGLIAKVIDRQASAGYGWNTVMQLAFAYAGKGWVNVETEWTPAALVSLAEKADAYSKATDMPFETKLREIMQYPPDKVERIMQERMADTFAGLMQPQPVTANGAQ
jgi:hypothetical protein